MNEPVRVLIVEDSRSSQVGLMAMLKRVPGFAPTLAETVAEALEHFAPGCRRPDVVILDLDLPGTPGERLIEALLVRGGPMPRIVVTTGIADAARERKVRDLHPDAFFAKPYCRDRLIAAIEGATPDREPQPEGD